MKENKKHQHFKTRPILLAFMILGILVLVLGFTPHVYAGGTIGGGTCNETDLKTAIGTGGTVDFSADCSITLTSEIAIAADVTINGSGHQVILDGNSSVRVINITSGTVVLDGLTIQNGTGLNGGGIHNNGILTVQNSTLAANTATGAFIDDEGFGGGIFLADGSTLTLLNSTVSGNDATEDAGGISVEAAGSATVNISHSTIANNTEQSGFGAGGVSLANSTTQNIKNSIIAYNLSDGVLFNSLTTLSSQGYNISDDDPFLGGALISDFISTDPKIDALADNGGPTQTHELQSDSVAIDMGEPTGCQDNFGTNITTDQREELRDDLRCDIGAFELKLSDSTTVIKTIGDGETGSFGPTLVEISRSGGADPGTITVSKTSLPPGGGAADPGEMPLMWNISPSGSDTGLSLGLKLCYTDIELGNGNNITEANLVQFRNLGSGPAWTNEGGTVDTGNNCVDNSITALSYWTLGDGTTVGNSDPTAVSLQNLSVTSTSQQVLIVVFSLAIMMVGLVTLAIRKKRM